VQSSSTENIKTFQKVGIICNLNMSLKSLFGHWNKK